ncbi:MAG: hypothetical protein Q9219_002918 [cf. Caloplaca sp. 3 TL-2023]
MPHLLGSAYLLGSPPDHLNEIYEKEAAELEPWQDSPGEVSTYDWRDHLGDPRYQRAYLDFFEDQLVLQGYDWAKVLEKYLLEGREPIVNNLISGPMEALSMACSSYDFLHKYLDNPLYTKASANSTRSPLELLCRVQKDARFNNLFTHEGASNIEPLFEKRENELLEYWNSWQITDPTKDFRASQMAAAALLVAPHKQGEKPYDFFIVHLLTTSHAVRILLPLLPARFHVPLVRQWWLLVLAVYIAQLRPQIMLTSVTDYDVQGKDWRWVDQQALRSEHAFDAHFVKALRAMGTGAQTWGDEDRFYLKAAVRFASEFDGWGGFGSEETKVAYL